MRISGSGSCVLLLLAVVLAAAIPAGAQDGTVAPTPDPFPLIGRVVDGDGEPIAGVELCAMPSGLPGGLSQALMQGSRSEHAVWHATTDEDGGFTIPVGFPGLLYRVGPREGSVVTFSRRDVIADPGVGVEIVARRRLPRPPVAGQVFRSDGSPAAGATVDLVGRYPGHRWTRRCDAVGRFRFDAIYARSWDGGLLFANLDGEVSEAYNASRLSAAGGRVELGLPAAGVGVLRDQDTGRPIAGATIIVEPRRYPQIRWTATTHDDGWFQVLDLPPGDYQYRAVCASHADQPPSVRRWDSRRVRLVAGETSELAGFHMQRRATLSGVVVDTDGRPVVGALVGCYSHAGNVSGAVDAVYTDSSGRYELRPGVFGGQYLRAVYAFHPSAGAGSTPIEVFLPDAQRDKLEPGMALGGLDIVLHGSTRVRGRVTGPDGEPLAGVRCGYTGTSVYATTDDEGRYDLGRVSLFDDAGHGGLRPVRTSARGRITDGSHSRWPDRVSQLGERYYISGGAHVEPGPGGETTVDLQLETTDVLTFGGRVDPPAEGRSCGSRVYLIHGRVEGADAHDSVLDFLKVLRRREEQIRTHGYVPELPIDHDICVFRSVRADKDGRWSVHHTRYDLERWARGADRIRAEGMTEDERVLYELGLELHAIQADRLPDETEWAAETEDAEAEPALRWVTVLVVLDDLQYALYEPIEVRADKVDYTEPAAVLP